MKNKWLLLLLLCSVDGLAREVQLLDKGWKFKKGDAASISQREYNDADWSQINIPHDWAIREHFNMNIDMQMVQVKEDGDRVAKLRTGRTGALPMFGVAWYRRELTIPAAEQGKRFWLEFDGVMRLAKVYVNGEFVGEWINGYTSFAFDITDKIRLGEKNILAVRVENEDQSSRWYSGAGIYRNVRLVTADPVHIAHWGTVITTPVVNARKSVVEVVTEINASVDDSQKAVLRHEIVDRAGKVVASREQKFLPGETKKIKMQMSVANPALWSVYEGNLYTLRSRILVGGQERDCVENRFGIRDIKYTADQGLLVNGKVVKVQGVCNHHDLGPLGAAVNIRALERQFEMLREMGCNAIRTSHNPPAPELLELADEWGFLVQVEAFDEWKEPKGANSYAKFFDEWSAKDIQNMVRRDRNHPSVIMWSLGNELREQRYEKGAELCKYLADICRSEDPTRAVTAGLNFPVEVFKTGLADALDIVGFNYNARQYNKILRDNPGKVVYGSETASTVSSRGVYKFPAKERVGACDFDYQVSSYDLEYPGWAYTPDVEFDALDRNPSIFGEFVWTGFDYLGEPTPFNEGTPARSSYFGIIDLAGLKKDRFYLYQSRWTKEPVLHMLPHWNWEGREGKEVPVFVYTNYPKAELFVNGKSQGVKTKTEESLQSKY
ncbi:MAG: glycoside hydrolase family 2 TIM barrel-domain containing protein, partial [Bacteroidales bacterium]